MSSYSDGSLDALSTVEADSDQACTRLVDVNGSLIDNEVHGVIGQP